MLFLSKFKILFLVWFLTGCASNKSYVPDDLLLRPDLRPSLFGRPIELTGLSDLEIQTSVFALESGVNLAVSRNPGDPVKVLIRLRFMNSPEAEYKGVIHVLGKMLEFEIQDEIGGDRVSGGVILWMVGFISSVLSYEIKAVDVR